MKRLLLVCLLALPALVFGQKLYHTNTGEISFYSKAPLEDIEAMNKKVIAVLNSETGVIIFKISVRSFDFPNNTMEEHFNENYLETEKYPTADFNGMVSDIKSVDFKKNGVYKVTVTGKMTIHNVTQNVSAPGTLEVKDGQVIGLSTFKIKLADYKIDIPKLVIKNIAEEVEVRVNIALKPKESK